MELWWLIDVGVQNKSPQDLPQWYADYFELKATLATGSKETSAPILPPQLPGRIWIRDLAHNKLLSEITSFDLYGRQTCFYCRSALITPQWPLETPKVRYLIPGSGCLTPQSPFLSPNFCLWGLWLSHVGRLPIHICVLHLIIFSC